MAKLVSMDLTNSNPCILHYTTTDGEILHFNNNAFDEKIISHTYTNKGIVIFEKPVLRIGSTAFSNKRTLLSITIPDSVISIEDKQATSFLGYYDSAFGGCTALSILQLSSNLIFIGKYAFADCRRLTNITIPDNVTKIGNSAFSGCNDLTSITIPDSVTTIGEGAFIDCNGLTGVHITNLTA